MPDLLMTSTGLTNEVLSENPRWRAHRDLIEHIALETLSEAEAVCAGPLDGSVSQQRRLRRERQALERAALSAAGYPNFVLVLKVLSIFMPTPVKIALFIVQLIIARRSNDSGE